MNKWPFSLKYESNKQVASPVKGQFIQMGTEKKLELMEDLDKIFLEIMALFECIYYNENNVHFTDSEVS